MKKFLSAAIIALSALFSAAAVLYRVFLRTDLRVFGGAPTKENREWLKSVKAKDTYIASSDGLFLHAQYIKNRSDKWAVVVHGYDSSSKNMADFAKMFYDEGYSVLLPDMRGYGLSETLDTTMGHMERSDVICWVRFLEEEMKAEKTVLFGLSMGAATVMLAAGEQLPKSVSAVIEDCGYSSVREEFEFNMKKILHMYPYPVLWAVDIITRLRMKWSVMRDVDCVKALRRANIPMLFIHGSADDFVPFFMHDKVFDACASEHKEKLIVYGAGHTECFYNEPELYKNTVFDFLEKYTDTKLPV